MVDLQSLLKAHAKINSYFDEADETVDYLSSNEIETEIQNRFKTGKTIKELIVQEHQLLRKNI